MGTRVIKLTNIGGFSLLNGEDKNGCKWIQWKMDWLAGEELGHCSICDKTIDEGWLCLDGGEEVCSEHVQYER